MIIPSNVATCPVCNLELDAKRSGGGKNYAKISVRCVHDCILDGTVVRQALDQKRGAIAKWFNSVLAIPLKTRWTRI